MTAARIEEEETVTLYVPAGRRIFGVAYAFLGATQYIADEHAENLLVGATYHLRLVSTANGNVSIVPSAEIR